VTKPNAPADAPAAVRDRGRSRGHPVYTSVFEELQERIRRGDWLPGTRLPSITRLAQELHVGTGSVREALQSLQSIGQVKIEHGRGVFVASRHPRTDISSHVHNIGIGQMMALAETRRILEPELTALAAERGTEAELVEIENLAWQMEAVAQQGGDFAELDVLFHQSIARAARNPILFRTIESVRDLFLESRRQRRLIPAQIVSTAHYHLLIAQAMRARNAPQARLLMQAHLSDMLNEVLSSEAKAEAKTEAKAGLVEV
jgi:GntR family transcriptional regulator, transcriptional repressor for pyruvate dehydrogenase complex